MLSERSQNICLSLKICLSEFHLQLLLKYLARSAMYYEITKAVLLVLRVLDCQGRGTVHGRSRANF